MQLSSKVTYPASEPTEGAEADPWHGRQSSWMLYVRLTVTGDEPLDLVSYQAQHADFPNQTTLDQDFDEPQFESYRCLGQTHRSTTVSLVLASRTPTGRVDRLRM